MDKEQAVRDAALALKTAITEAAAAGYRVEWPGKADDLDRIAVSSTSKVVEEAKPPAASTGFASRPAAKPFGDN